MGIPLSALLKIIATFMGGAIEVQAGGSMAELSIHRGGPSTEKRGGPGRRGGQEEMAEDRVSRTPLKFVRHNSMTLQIFVSRK